MLLTSKRQTTSPARGFPGPQRAHGRPAYAWPPLAQRVTGTPCACGGGCPRCAAGPAVQDAASPIVAYDPQVGPGEGHEEGPAASTTGAAATVGPGAAAHCKVQSFS